ncbi:hypothetical protein RHGRI_021748 [Rhododendron griersonianum]|uniref:F-box domain-containing protein n=1 Tax=Rhododendron griersonianum TaxID=479676 RepID=A0AAV6JST2_9ERIC|nr:hypothetical protein RHGRI_021748 [Rhododendron griersonianum]
MDPGIWSQLPGVLLERILSFLPLKNFLSLRSTCKYFKSLIFSPPFISKHSSPSSSSSLSSFLLSHPHFHLYYPLYDTILKAWRTLPLSVSPLLSCAPSGPHLLSVSHGLLCFSLPNSSSFLVYNLLARSSRVVEFPEHNFAFELLTLVSSPDGYKLFMLGSSSGSSNKAFVYDSRLHLWHQFDRVDSVLGDNFLQEGVSYHGYLYFTTPEPFSIVCFDLESGKWEKLMTELPGELTFARLVSKGDEKLLLIAGIGQHGISRELKLWELNEGNWVEIERVPETMCRKFMSICYHNYEHVYAFWHQGLICLCCYTWPEILYYKVSRGTWHWLPKCPSLPEKWSCGFRWFSFIPELHASV